MIPFATRTSSRIPVTITLVGLLLLGLAATSAAQLSGPKTIPGDYATNADAITD